VQNSHEDFPGGRWRSTRDADFRRRSGAPRTGRVERYVAEVAALPVADSVETPGDVVFSRAHEVLKTKQFITAVFHEIKRSYETIQKSCNVLFKLSL
jgi:hypothetical protein